MTYKDLKQYFLMKKKKKLLSFFSMKKYMYALYIGHIESFVQYFSFLRKRKRFYFTKEHFKCIFFFYLMHRNV